MTSITNLGSSGYYQLSSSSSGSSATTTASLAQALSNADQSNNDNSAAYLLNLSPQAKQYLSGVPSSASTDSGSFILSSQQRQAVTDIIAKYKDAPYTQDTFNKIQDDLNAAGLGTTTLSMKDQAQAFNPSLVLINALNGGAANDANSGYASSDSEQAKSSNFIQQIISQWKSIAGNNTASDPVDTGSDETGIAPVSASGEA